MSAEIPDTPRAIAEQVAVAWRSNRTDHMAAFDLYAQLLGMLDGSRLAAIDLLTEFVGSEVAYEIDLEYERERA